MIEQIYSLSFIVNPYTDLNLESIVDKGNQFYFELFIYY
jgi:hypothetical protein